MTQNDNDPTGIKRTRVSTYKGDQHDTKTHDGYGNLRRHIGDLNLIIDHLDDAWGSTIVDWLYALADRTWAIDMELNGAPAQKTLSAEDLELIEKAEELEREAFDRLVLTNFAVNRWHVRRTYDELHEFF